METFNNMLGVTMKSVDGDAGDGTMLFTAEDGRQFRFYHEQDCCEDVRIEDVAGDLKDLVGSPILQAEEVEGEAPATDYPYESETWTFYKFATQKGSVTVRWLGTSNGYYGEGVDYQELPAREVTDA